MSYYFGLINERSLPVFPVGSEGGVHKEIEELEKRVFGCTIDAFNEVQDSESSAERMDVDEDIEELAETKDSMSLPLSGENAFSEGEKASPFAFDVESSNAHQTVEDLHQAIINDDWKSVVLMIKNGISIDEVGSKGDNALHVALKKGSIEMCQLLLECGANPGLPTADNVSPLILAAIRESWELVEMLYLSGADINEEDNFFYYYVKAVLGLEDMAQRIKALGTFDIELSKRKFLGNVWGIRGRTTWRGEAVKLAGFFGNVMFKKIANHFEKYLNSASIQQLIAKKPHNSAAVLRSGFANFTASTDELFKQIKTGEPTVLMLNMDEHLAGLVFDRDHILLCDRGALKGDFGPGVQIYRTQPGFDLRAFIEGIKEIDDCKSMASFINSELRLSCFVRYLTTINLNPQKMGNCTFTSTAAVIYALLLIDRRDMLLANSITPHAAVTFEECSPFAKQIYQEWLYDFRKEALARYLKNSSERDPSLLQRITAKIEKLLRTATPQKMSRLLPIQQLLHANGIFGQKFFSPVVVFKQAAHFPS